MLPFYFGGASHRAFHVASAPIGHKRQLAAQTGPLKALKIAQVE